MRIGRTFLGLLFATLVWSAGAFASEHPAPEPGAQLKNAVLKLGRSVPSGSQGSALLAEMIQKEYGTRAEELKWAAGQKLGWGDITALAYIQATTGKSFAEMIENGAQRDYWAYADNAGMNCEKMTRSLDDFLKRVERERNTRIFDGLRASRQIHPIPDLGNGFGLYQEALDFRHINIAQPNKVIDVPGDLAKGGQ